RDTRKVEQLYIKHILIRMSGTTYNKLKHIFIMIGIVAILSLGMVYPFLPGAYDRLAMPLSIVIQAFGVMGILLAIIGLGWLIMPKYSYSYARAAWYVSVFISIVIAFFAFLSAGKVFGIILLFIGIMTLRYLKSKLNEAKASDQQVFSILPVYLIGLPVLLLIIQLTIAQPLKQWSRNSAIKNAAAYIDDIENFRKKEGYYPPSLQAMYKDYYPQIVGIDKYHYLAAGDAYNLSFEQPRFLLDVIGTKEWVVYNPRDEHRVYSHTSWFLLLSPAELERSQGWYASEQTEHAHWKSFLFD
ncbi:MAG: hypothetical protein ACK4TA_16780, partial [Saprospiraceae bacterium]